MSTDWTNVRREADRAKVMETLRRAQRITASPAGMDEMRRRFPPTEPDPAVDPQVALALSRLYGAPITVDADVPDGFVYAGGVLLDLRESVR